MLHDIGRQQNPSQNRGHASHEPIDGYINGISRSQDDGKGILRGFYTVDGHTEGISHTFLEGELKTLVHRIVAASRWIEVAELQCPLSLNRHAVRWS